MNPGKASEQPNQTPSATEPHSKGNTWDGSHPPPVGAPEVCGCDESKAWQSRALKAERRVRAIGGWVRGLLRRVDETLGALDE